MELTEVDENCDAEDEEETISNHKKSQFEKPVNTAGVSLTNKMQDFQEDGELERINKEIRKEAEQKDELYFRILHSKNKDFSNLLQTSESQSSEIEMVVSKNISQKAMILDKTDDLVAQTKAVATIKHYLQMQLRKALKVWRSQTDLIINEHRFRVRNYRLLLQKQRVLVLINLKVANKLALLRFVFKAFANWKLETQIDKRLLDRKQQTFLLHNTKLEI